MSFSFKKGRKIAIVKGGKYDGKFLRIFDKKSVSGPCCGKCSDDCKDGDIKKCCSKCKGGCMVNDITNNIEHVNKYIKKFKKDNGKNMTTSQLNAMEKVLFECVKFVEEQNDDMDEFKLTDGILVPLLDEDDTQLDRGVVFGVSGSGKSYLVGKMLEEFKKLNPKKDIVIFSNVMEDEALDVLKPIRIPLDMNLVTDPISDEELSNTVVVFDDIDTEKNKKVRDTVVGIRDHLCEVGRHTKTYVVNTMHQLNFTRKETRIVLNEATFLIFFPKSGSVRPIVNYFKNIVGIDSKEIKRLVRLPSRWVQINRKYPQCVLYDTGAISLYNLMNTD